MEILSFSVIGKSYRAQMEKGNRSKLYGEIRYNVLDESFEQDQRQLKHESDKKT